MEMKAFVIMEDDGGQYEDYNEFPVSVLRGPASSQIVELRKEYLQAMKDRNAAEKEIYKTLKGEARKEFRMSSRQPFQDWLAQWKGFEKMEFETCHGY